MVDEEIISLFFDRSEQAIQELDRKYGPYCMRISKGILCDERDAQECVNTAYMTVWDKIPPERPRYLQAYLAKIVRQKSLDRWKYNRQPRRFSAYDVALHELQESFAAPETMENTYDAKELKVALEDFLDTLDEENSTIFLRRYWFSDTYAQISKMVGISEKNVSVRLTRMRKQMRDYLCERGFDV